MAARQPSLLLIGALGLGGWIISLVSGPASKAPGAPAPAPVVSAAPVASSMPAPGPARSLFTPAELASSAASVSPARPGEPAVVRPRSLPPRVNRHGKELAPGIAVEEQLSRKGAYTNVRGETVHVPSARIGGGEPDGATAYCGDGSYSFSHSRSGTCSRHGGVTAWLR